ncbi:hypothetical protein FN976_26150 [Caenimonas sedimenti]|uniref:Uncharacterized protein n=1 Tax=Caenimonas sedimenti TaxID=2596921 RepID=A0A562ZGU0_9BURK|nr:hypothetical protein [Caenimonas sedimenti]TWO67017.1 hypothetical protein FN976_26150 [Caenimonas sedimenti]
MITAGLAACGGGGGDDDAPKPPVLVRASGPSEFVQCTTVPSAVRVVREQDNGQWRTNRYVAFGAEPLAKMLPPAASTLETGKNPEGVLDHGPLQAQNCAPGSGQTQTLRLRVRTEDFFSTGIGDHLAFGLRAYYPTANREGEESYEALGVILHRAWGGALAERFRRPGGNDIGTAAGDQVMLQDGTTYLVEMQASITQLMFRVTNEATGQTTGWKTYQQPADFAPATGTGFLFAVLCQDNNARCEAYDRPFRVDVSEIVLGWM